MELIFNFETAFLSRLSIAAQAQVLKKSASPSEKTTFQRRKSVFSLGNCLFLN